MQNVVEPTPCHTYVLHPLWIDVYAMRGGAQTRCQPFQEDGVLLDLQWKNVCSETLVHVLLNDDWARICGIVDHLWISKESTTSQPTQSMDSSRKAMHYIARIFPMQTNIY
jgi:hypothetical protein